jgi:UDP-N-acetylglucosamine:LPS N-acetylglucosamine transferase
MPFPEFEPRRRKVLFFSRGRGRGHAVPDIAIAQALNERREDVDIRFVSYAAGAATLSAAGLPLIDVDVTDVSPLAELTALSGKLIRWLNPDLVVAHEEFAVPPVAKIFDKPAVFIVDFFTTEEMHSMAALKFADEILFTGQEGRYTEPSWVRDKVRYVGPVFREFRYRRGDRNQARAELGIPTDALVVGVFPGSWNEITAPAVELITAAFDVLKAPMKRLLWVNSAGSEEVDSRLAKREDTLVVGYSCEIDRIMCVTDVAITKANRMTAQELAMLGIPTIALSYELNVLDDIAVTGLEGVQRLLAREIDAQKLSTAIHALSSVVLPERPRPEVPASHICAEMLSRYLR